MIASPASSPQDHSNKWGRINLTPLPVPSYRHSYRLGIVIQFVRENSQSIEPHCLCDMNIPQLKEKLDNLSTTLPLDARFIIFTIYATQAF